MEKKVEQRFWTYVVRLGDDECWLWSGAIAKGYGQFTVSRYQRDDGRWQSVVRRAHRVAYELLVGPIPDGLTLDHLCKVRNCVNPKHLEPTTAGENSRRGSTLVGKRCKAGLHDMVGYNLVRRPNVTWVECRECSNIAQRRRKAARAA